jgi:hypothetical protein
MVMAQAGSGKSSRFATAKTAILQKMQVKKR